ncbi:MAG: hypothetical protein JWN04_820 [Myxococcaceae bacterium]|nr:hypothetical protein [Myxococcaceae bacterium]
MLDERAQHLRGAAESVGTAGIASDDPEALEQLQGKLHALEATRTRMKQLNVLARKKGWEAVYEEAGEAERVAIDRNRRFSPGGTDVPFPAYKLTNLAAEVRRVRMRCAVLEKLSTQPAREKDGAGWHIREDVIEGRVIIEFDEQQPENVIAALKSTGWNWARSQGAWTRKRTENAWRSANQFVEQFFH